MEPQNNIQISLRKAISAHEEAEAAMVDLMRNDPDPRFQGMLDRIRQSLNELRLAAERTEP